MAFLETLGDTADSIASAAGAAYIAKILTPPPASVPPMTAPGGTAVATPNAAAPAGLPSSVGMSTLTWIGIALLVGGVVVLIARRGG